MKLHFGCGNNILPGWENIDLNGGKERKAMDVTKNLPYKDNTIDFIFHEHLIEHLDEVEGFNFMKECFRILKPEGIMRISCPSIDGAIKVYQNWDKVNPEWKIQFGLSDKNTFINHVIYFEASGYKGKRFDRDGNIIEINNHYHWHKYLYDRENFSTKLKMIGFREVKFVEKLQSESKELRNLERRIGGKFESFPPEIDITLETKK